LPFFNLLPTSSVLPTTNSGIVSVDHYPALLPESATQPDALDNPTPATDSNPHPHITGIEYVRFVRYNWSFLPRYIPYLFSRSSIYLPVNSEGVSYRRQIRTAPTGCPSYQLPAPERRPVEHFATGIARAMPWPTCPPAGPDKQRGACAGDYLG
jgi:hypothetical protein